MKIGILGSGLMGGKLGVLFTRAGHDVVFSDARSEQKLKGLVLEHWRQLLDQQELGLVLDRFCAR